MNDIGTDAVHEILRMGDDEKSSLVLAELALKPDTCFEIEMVGGLV